MKAFAGAENNWWGAGAEDASGQVEAGSGNNRRQEEGKQQGWVWTHIRLDKGLILKVFPVIASIFWVKWEMRLSADRKENRAGNSLEAEKNICDSHFGKWQRDVTGRAAKAYQYGGLE